jgi:chemotaxis regulatin CheY-phosphate phosphatase CheZ
MDEDIPSHARTLVQEKYHYIGVLTKTLYQSLKEYLIDKDAHQLIIHLLKHLQK